MDDLEALQPTTINMKEANNEGLLISEHTLLRNQALVKESTSVEERQYIPFTSQNSLDYKGGTRPPTHQLFQISLRRSIIRVVVLVQWLLRNSFIKDL